MQTASIVGIIIAVLSIAALAAFAVWEEWLNLMAGLSLMVSPWLLGFQDSQAMTIDVAIGMSVAVLAAFEAWYLYEASQRVDKPEQLKIGTWVAGVSGVQPRAFQVPISDFRDRCLAFRTAQRL